MCAFDKRRERLVRVKLGDPVMLSEVVGTDARSLIDATKMGLEGIVAKRKDSVCESGKRTGAWVKYKINRGQEFVNWPL